jgi:hypothetical protein
MNNMKKIIAGISIALGMLIPLLASSQKAFISLGAEFAIPAIDYSETGNSGFGGSVRMEHPWSKHVSGILSVEYLQYSTREINSDFHEQFSVLPVQFGIKYYTKEKTIYPAGFYLSAELGFTGEFYRYDFSDPYNKIDTHHDTYIGFCNTMGAGYQLGIMDAGFRFQTILSANSGITLYYNFRLAFTIR